MSFPCIVKNCKNEGTHEVILKIDDVEGPFFVCDEDYEIISGVNYLSIEDTDLDPNEIPH